jgi:hypothetical protein
MSTAGTPGAGKPMDQDLARETFPIGRNRFAVQLGQAHVSQPTLQMVLTDVWSDYVRRPSAVVLVAAVLGSLVLKVLMT